MGRAKLSMELISKERSRTATFKKRKAGLIKKMVEFTTLCDVSACMIIYCPKQETGAAVVEPEIWPENPEEVRRIVEIYKSKTRESGNKTFGLTDFFKDRKKKVEDDLAKLRKKNLEAKYPTKIDFINAVPESKLRAFAAELMERLDYVKSRIEFLRSQEQTALMDMSFVPFYNPAAAMQGFEVINPLTPAVKPYEGYPQYPYSDHHQHHHQEMQQNSLMMLLTNENFREGSNTGNIQCASIQQFIYESSNCGVAGDTIGHNPRQLGRHYPPVISPPVQPQYVPMIQPVQPPPYAQCTAMVPFSTEDNGEDAQDYIPQYQMNNYRAYYD